MTFTLTVRLGEKLIDSFEFDKDIVTIGRAPESDVCIDNLAVSRIHAIIERRDVFYILRDMQSNNGTYIHGRRIERYTLNNEDTFHIGKYSINFRQPEGQGLPAPTPIVQQVEVAKTDTFSTMSVDEHQMKLLQQEQDDLAAYLDITAPQALKHKLALSAKAVFFGKHRDCEFPLRGRHASKRHVLIYQNRKAFFIIHLGNHLPPKVNNQEIDYHRLQDGDRIEIENYQMTFHVGSP